jgi:alpha-tubulin suppressor-like RCC1 family protein
LTEDGALFTWETPTPGDADPDDPMPELGYGYGRLIHDRRGPDRVRALAGERITSVAVGNEFTVAATAAGAVYSFGRGDGRLGHGEGDEHEEVSFPRRVEALVDVYVTTVAAGDYHALALRGAGVSILGARTAATALCTVTGMTTKTTSMMRTFIFLK